MDQPQPSPAPTTTPASSPAEVSPALPGSPETQPPQAPPTTPAPQDPYANYRGLDYEELLQEFGIEGMDAQELASVHGPADTLVQRFGSSGFREALTTYGAGNDPEILRGLAAAERDYQGLLGEVRQMNAGYKDLSQRLGRSVSAIPDPPPPRGAELDRQVQMFVDRYFPTSSREGYREFVQQPAVMQTLTRVVQEFSRFERSLQTAGTQRQAMQQQWDSPEALRTMPDGRKFTNEDLDLEYSRLWNLRHAASRANDRNEIERLDKLIVRVGKARFGG